MRIRFFGISGLSLTAIVGLLLTFQLEAQNKPAKPPKQSNVQGGVQNTDKAKMTITISTGNVKKDVIYSADTKFLYGHSKDNKPGAIDQVKDNYFISCSGTYDAGKVKLKATECVYRETK